MANNIDIKRIAAHMATEWKLKYGGCEPTEEAMLMLAETAINYLRNTKVTLPKCTCKDVVGRTWSFECPVHGTKHNQAKGFG